MRDGCAPCANSRTFLYKPAGQADRLGRGCGTLHGVRLRGNNILSVSARAISAVANCRPNCLSGSGRVVIKLRASRPLGEDIGPFKKLHVTRRTYGTCNCRISSGVLGRFGGEAARGSKIFGTCSTRVEGIHRTRVLAKLPSTCNENEVVNSCHHITLCNATGLVRFGRTSCAGLSGHSVDRRSVHGTRRVAGRVVTLHSLARVTRDCNCSVALPTGGTERTIR